MTHVPSDDTPSARRAEPMRAQKTSTDIDLRRTIALDRIPIDDVSTPMNVARQMGHLVRPSRGRFTVDTEHLDSHPGPLPDL
jgi:hypothetical protein